MTAAFVTQIELDPEGVAWLSGTRTKVVEVVLDKIANGWSPEEIHFQHPYLSMAQVHAALTYYFENQSRLDEQMRRGIEETDRLAADISDPAFQRRLVELKKQA